MRGLLHQLGISENERLQGMTEAAIRSMHVDRTNHRHYLSMLRWKLYLIYLRLRLWWGDIFVECYYRRFMKQDMDLFIHVNEDISPV